MKRTARVLITAAIAGVVGFAGGQVSAHAAVNPVSATTHVINDADSGGNGNWAIDDFRLQVNLNSPVSCGSSCYNYTGSMSATGTSTTIVGAFRPNQGLSPGLKILGGPFKVSMTGSADYSFQSDHLADPSLAPATIDLHGSGGVGTGSFYQKLFPAGTVFTDNGAAFNNSWSFIYRDVKCSQIWTDAWNNSDGQSLRAGNITGGPACAATASVKPHVFPNLKNVGGFTPSIASTKVASTGVGGGKGVWANAKFTRTAMITGGADVSLPNCSPQAKDCYIYQIDIKDTGTFRSVRNAFRPNQTVAGKKINGVVNGNVTGTYEVEFYSSGVPHEEIVPGGKSGNLDTAHWYKMFFGAGTRFGTAGLASPKFSEVYSGCGQKWADSNTNSNGQLSSAGNIKGGNCTATLTAAMSVHPDTSNQYCFTTDPPTACVRIQNNGGNGSAVVVGATDINGPAENATFNPTTTYNYHGTMLAAGTLQFTGHTNECLAGGAAFQATRTDVCNGVGTIWVPVADGGGIKFLNRSATQGGNGDDYFLAATSESAGSSLTQRATDGSFERFKSCSANC